MTSKRPVDLRALLDAVEAASPTQGVDALAGELARLVGAAEVSFLIADVAGGTLVRLARPGGDGEAVRDREPADTLLIAGTAPGDALRTQTLQIEPVQDGDGVWVFAPVTERGEAVGVLELLLPYQPDSETVDYLAAAAHALAYVVDAAVVTDLYECGSRSAPLTLEAEISGASCRCPTRARRGSSPWRLARPGRVGGDTSTSPSDRDVLHLSITDAMGHGVAAALLATWGSGAFATAAGRACRWSNTLARPTQALDRPRGSQTSS